jgi:hypothetical protein
LPLSAVFWIAGGFAEGNAPLLLWARSSFRTVQELIPTPDGI